MLAWSSEAPWIADHMSGPASGTVEVAGSFASRGHQPFGKMNQWQMQFREIADLARPVVHLYINIKVIVAVPRGLDSVGPQALQVRW